MQIESPFSPWISFEEIQQTPNAIIEYKLQYIDRQKTEGIIWKNAMEYDKWYIEFEGKMCKASFVEFARWCLSMYY